MTNDFQDKNMLVTGLLTGAKFGFISGIGVMLLTFYAASLLKGLITDYTGKWPEWFGYGPHVDFVLSGWTILIILVLFTVGGATVGALTRRRYELL
jgi:hypothetical protein